MRRLEFGYVSRALGWTGATVGNPYISIAKWRAQGQSDSDC